MITAVLEPMPDLFWELVKEKGLQNRFFEFPDINKDKTEIAIIRTKTVFDAGMMDSFPNIKLIIRAGSGVDNIDIEEAARRNIQVMNTPKANAQAAAEHTLAMILSLIKHLPRCKEAVLTGSWKNNLQHNMEFSELRVLVVGVGNVGSRVVGMLTALGAEVRGVDPYLTEADKENFNIPFCSYKIGLGWCNLVTFHCPLTAESKDYFTQDSISLLNSPIFLINSARGGIINEGFLSKIFDNKFILGVGIDVFSTEPTPKFDYFRKKNVLISPHAGAHTNLAKQRLSVEVLGVWGKFQNTKNTKKIQ
jgi:D-3-phosphoglycerate dehydrogenase / 2-oxoglutarate reductase